jgi:hypothetical protein
LKYVPIVVTYLIRIRIELNGVCVIPLAYVSGINKHHCQRSMQNANNGMWKNVKSLWKSKWNVWHFPPHAVYAVESPTIATLYDAVHEQYILTSFFFSDMNST